MREASRDERTRNAAGRRGLQLLACAALLAAFAATHDHDRKPTVAEQVADSYALAGVSCVERHGGGASTAAAYLLGTRTAGSSSYSCRGSKADGDYCVDVVARPGEFASTPPRWSRRGHGCSDP